MSVKIQIRRDTSAQWSSTNPVLAAGEIGYETNTRKMKIGNGSTAWNSLSYAISASGIAPAGSVGSVQYKSGGGAFSGSSEFAFDRGSNTFMPGEILKFPAISNPSSPPAESLYLYSREVCGRAMTRQIGPSGLYTSLQPFLGQINFFLTSPGTATTISSVGYTFGGAGTISHPALASTSMWESMRRARIATTSTAGNSASIRSTVPLLWRGNASGLGGFFYSCRFGVATTTANQRMFCGLTISTTAFGNANPSTLFNLVGVGNDSADTNLQVMHNDGSGAATKVNLGATYPAKTANIPYEFMMFAAPNASSIEWRMIRLDTAAETSGTITTDMPSNTTVLSFQAWMNNGTTAAAAHLEINRIYGESDF
jgi:hypothetical protein